MDLYTLLAFAFGSIVFVGLPALAARQPDPQVQEDVEVARGDRSVRETPTDRR